jgi:hypothetical protein
MTSTVLLVKVNAHERMRGEVHVGSIGLALISVRFTAFMIEVIRALVTGLDYI